MLLDKSNSCLLLIDVQEKLTPLVFKQEFLIKRLKQLLSLAKSLEIPTIVCEQYPKGLGHTIEELKPLMKSDLVIEKLHFSCGRDMSFKRELINFNKKQLVLMGIETHVCVMQTALNLLADNYEIFVVADAVSARNEIDHRYGLKRMKQAGVELVTAEMVFFEWLEQAGTEEFKLLSKEFFS